MNPDGAGGEEESYEDWKLRMTVRQWEQTERLRAMSPEEFAEEFAATRERTRLEELFWADQVAAGEEEMWHDICEDLGG